MDSDSVPAQIVGHDEEATWTAASTTVRYNRAPLIHHTQSSQVIDCIAMLFSGYSLTTGFALFAGIISWN
jgi:hypothetical protein